MQHQSQVKPRQLYSGPLIELNKFTKTINAIMSFHLENVNDIIQYCLICCLIIVYMYNYCTTINCSNRTVNREGGQVDQNQEGQRLIETEMQTVRDVSHSHSQTR